MARKNTPQQQAAIDRLLSYRRDGGDVDETLFLLMPSANVVTNTGPYVEVYRCCQYIAPGTVTDPETGEVREIGEPAYQRRFYRIQRDGTVTGH